MYILKEGELSMLISSNEHSVNIGTLFDNGQEYNKSLERFGIIIDNVFHL